MMDDINNLSQVKILSSIRFKLFDKSINSYEAFSVTLPYTWRLVFYFIILLILFYIAIISLMLMIMTVMLLFYYGVHISWNEAIIKMISL